VLNYQIEQFFFCPFAFYVIKFLIAQGRWASLMQSRILRDCLRFFAAMRLCHCCNLAKGETEPQKAPNA
jgi:hypothetical protein